MIDVNYKTEGEKLTLFIEGRIDSANAPEIEGKMRGILEEHPSEHIIIDCEKLEYTTSAGLRVVLRLKQDVDDTKIINASREVYDILDMTGFTEMMEVERAYRVFSVEGCEVIGQGANGKVYRIDRDTIVKVYLNPDALPEIHRERELASMYNAYCGYAATDHSIDEIFLGIDYETCCAFWKKSLQLYLGTEDEARLREVEDKAKVIGYTRIMRREIRRNGLSTESSRAVIENARKELGELLLRVDTLVF